MSVEKPVKHFSSLEDLRCAGKFNHRLIDTLVILVRAVIACAGVLHGGGRGKRSPNPTVDHATRTESGHPRSSIRLRTAAAMATSVARAWSPWKRNPSPMTCFQRAN